MGVGNLHNGYIYPQNMNTTRAKAVKSGGVKRGPSSAGTIGQARKNAGSVSKNITPKTNNPIKHSSFMPKQIQTVSKNVGNAPAKGFGR